MRSVAQPDRADALQRLSGARARPSRGDATGEQRHGHDLEREL